jgi:hypothetical protein
MAQTFSGSTEDAQAPILKQSDWKKGMVLEGVVEDTFQTKLENKNGICYNVLLKTPGSISLKRNGKEEKPERVAIGDSAGFLMALQAGHIPNRELKIGDLIRLECTGMTPTISGQSPRTNFKINVVRR